VARSPWDFTPWTNASVGKAGRKDHAHNKCSEKIVRKTTIRRTSSAGCRATERILLFLTYVKQASIWASGVPMKNPEKARARKEVARRFRAFFETLQAELAGSADEVWRRVEGRLHELPTQQQETRETGVPRY
jgi:hypothetical protein